MFKFTICKRRQSGHAVVEFALVLPLLTMLILGTVEAGRAVTVQHSLQSAAQAGCRVYSVKGTTTQNATDIIAEAMSDAGLSNYTVNFDPSSKAAIDEHLEPVTVTITLPFSEVAWLSPTYLAGADLVATCVFPADIQDETGDSTPYFPLEDDNVADGNIRDTGDDDDDDDD